MRQPLASVIIPAYNAERFLHAAVESVLAQTHQNLEVFIVDDGSTDGTARIAAEFARRDPRVRVLTQANAGVGAARNRGIAEAHGEFIAPLDADDFWFPEKLAEQIGALESRGTSWGMAYCWSKSVDEYGTIREPLTHWPVEGDIFTALVYRNVIGNASVPLFRASVLRRAGPYLTRAEQNGAQGCEDWDLTLRVAALTLTAEVPMYLTAYRQAPGTMSSHPERMEQSYHISVRNLRQRHPSLPNSLARWSAGHFYLYLLNTCYSEGNHTACLRLLGRLLRADPAMILSPTVYRVAVMSGIRMVAGRNFLRRSRHEIAGWNPGHALWIPAHWIEKRRWAAIQRKRPSP